MNDGSILMAPVSSTYLGTTVPWALTVVAASRGSARVGSDTAYRASPPLRRLMALSSPATIELTGPPYTSAAAGLPSAVVPFWTLRPRAPSAMEPRVTKTATTVTRISHRMAGSQPHRLVAAITPTIGPAAAIDLKW